MQQTDMLEDASAITIGPDDIPDCDLYWKREFFDVSESDGYFQTLSARVQWRQDAIKYGRKVIQVPRLTAWYGNSGKNYAYSGISMKPVPWSAPLLKIKQAVDDEAGVEFNSVLLNYYRDERDSVAWHSDDEPELGKNPIIASVSFGATRRFVMKHKKQKQLAKIEMELSHGSLLLMRGPTQHHWLHTIPKSRVPVGPRINLTFRVIY
jgi:alkylated DNA repair dioxygenase AlkB